MASTTLHSNWPGEAVTASSISDGAIIHIEDMGASIDLTPETLREILSLHSPDGFND